MIIWSRWGILVLVTLGLGVGSGALLGAVLAPGTTEGAGFGVFMGLGLVLAGVYTFLLNRFAVAPHLDKPRPHVVLQPLPQPVTHPNGVRQTHQQIPVLHPQTGQPLYVQPRSSFFFVPIAAWPYVFAAIGLLVIVGCLIALLAG